MKNKVFVGIDQTGAVNSKGIPKPLPTCLILQKPNQKLQVEFKSLASLTQEHSLNLFKLCGDEYFQGFTSAIFIVDTVFGLPSEGMKTHRDIRECFKKAAEFQYQGRAYGAQTAFHFFNSLRLNYSKTDFEEGGLKTLGPLPEREIEKLLGANSVFKLQPFQKNIGCGSFRIWKELGQNSDWFSLWPFDQFEESKPVFFEGYPSYSWKNLFQIKSRNIDELISKIKNDSRFDLSLTQAQKKFMREHPDHVDAFVLALTGLIMSQDLKYLKKTKSKNLEGWILGCDPITNKWRQQ